MNEWSLWLTENSPLLADISQKPVLLWMLQRFDQIFDFLTRNVINYEMKWRRPLIFFNPHCQACSKIKLATISVETLYLNGPFSRFVNFKREKMIIFCFLISPKQTCASIWDTCNTSTLNGEEGEGEGCRLFCSPKYPF